jgi:hypothetical protein
MWLCNRRFPRGPHQARSPEFGLTSVTAPEIPGKGQELLPGNNIINDLGRDRLSSMWSFAFNFFFGVLNALCFAWGTGNASRRVSLDPVVPFLRADRATKRLLSSSPAIKSPPVLSLESSPRGSHIPSFRTRPLSPDLLTPHFTVVL